MEQLRELKHASAPSSADVDDRVAREAARHPAAWRFLLPRRVDGPVVLANLDRVTTLNLLRSYPSAIVLGRSPGDIAPGPHALLWDGKNCPLCLASVALVICDDRDGTCAEALAPALASGGKQVAIVSSARPYSFALFPTPEQLRAVIGRGWPLTYDGSPRRWFGYWLATTSLWRFMPRSGLAVPWPGDSVIDVVLDQISAATGDRAELCGFIAGRGLGQLPLRVRTSGQELAVRAAVTPHSATRLRNHQSALAHLRDHLGPDQKSIGFPRTVASGSVEDVSWAAESWLKSRAVHASYSWRPSGSGWAVLRAIAAELAAGAKTGYLGDGWGDSWTAGLEAVAPALKQEILRALVPIEAARILGTSPAGRTRRPRRRVRRSMPCRDRQTLHVRRSSRVPRAVGHPRASGHGRRREVLRRVGWTAAACPPPRHGYSLCDRRERGRRRRPLDRELGAAESHADPHRAAADGP